MSQARFAMVPVDAITDDALTATQLRVLLVIGSYLSRDNSAFPKQKTIADTLGIARETVNRSVKVLVERRYIAVTHRKRDDGGQRENLYHVLLDPCDPSITAPVTQEDHTPCDDTGSHPRPPHSATSSNSDELDLGDTPPEQPKRKAAPRGAARGSRIPDNWAPSPKDYAYASSKGVTPEEINNEAERFRNHWLSATGKSATKRDWSATWRNWIIGDYGIVERKRKAADRAASNGNRNGGKLSAFERFDQRMEAAASGQEPRFNDERAGGEGYTIDAEATRLAG